MLKIDFWKDTSKLILGYLIIHAVMTTYSAITGILPHSFIPGRGLTMEINYLLLIVVLILIPIFVHRLFLKKGSVKINLKDISKILNGAFFLGVVLGLSERSFLVLGISLILVLILGYINFFRG